MAVKRTPFIAGNWKMNLDHLQSIAFVQKLAWSLADARHDFADAEVAVFPPFTDLRSVQTLVAADSLPIGYGAQDLSAHDSGAYTGEISGAFLSQLGCGYVIIGHSERRTLHGETDADVNAKIKAAHRHGLVPVVCVGETAEDLEAHGPSAVPVAQLRAALDGVDGSKGLVVAYEPVWAIGSGQAATPAQAEQVAAALRALLVGTRRRRGRPGRPVCSTAARSRRPTSRPSCASRTSTAPSSAARASTSTSSRASSRFKKHVGA